MPRSTRPSSAVTRSWVRAPEEAPAGEGSDDEVDASAAAAAAAALLPASRARRSAWGVQGRRECASGQEREQAGGGAVSSSELW